jgi:glycosyltransferase involved in cell wall biosynthesis
MHIEGGSLRRARPGSIKTLITAECARGRHQTVYVNGKFTARPISGVERVATELVKALDRLPQTASTRWVLLCPPQASPPPLVHIEVRHVGLAGMPLHLWEQGILPWAAKAGLLLNLTGSAPYFCRTQACFIHDAAVFDVPLVYTALFRVWYRALFRRHVRRMTPLFTVSVFSQQRLGMALGRTAYPISVIPNGADHLDQHAADTRVLKILGLDGLPYFLALSNGSSAKNLTGVVQAYARVAARHPVQLVLVGRPNPRVFSRVSGDSGTAQVVEAGVVSDAALKALMSDAVALVFPSIYEGFGLPALEAMSCGCPVVASNVTALPEVCGTAALYADPDSVTDIANAMEQVLVDPGLRRRLQDAGRQQAARFRWETSARSLVGHLGLLAGKHLGAPAGGL